MQRKEIKLDKLEMLSVLVNACGLTFEAYADKTPNQKKAFAKIESAISDLFQEIDKITKPTKRKLDGPIWVEEILNFIETLGDDFESMRYDPRTLAKSFGFNQAHGACYGFEGDMFVDSRGRCFSVDALCEFDPEDEYEREYEFKTKAGKDYTAVTHSGWYTFKVYLRRVDPKSFHYCRWDKKSLAKYKSDKGRKTGEEPYRGMFFQLQSAAQQISIALETKTKTNQ